MDEKLPPPIQVIQGGGGGGNGPKDDDSLVDIKVKNPFQKFFDWIKNFIKRNQNITIKIPIIGLLIALPSFAAGLGSGYNWGFNAAVSKLFPYSSPILHRSITLEGTIAKSDSDKYYLKTEDNLWTLKPKNSSVNLTNYLNQQVQVLGNLTKEANLVEVSEIIPLNIQTSPTSLTTPTTPNLPDSPSPAPSGMGLPNLYSALDWEKTQKRVLIFTSGKRKIEQEGIYLESAQVTAFPQDFINYYLEEFKNKGFKQTLNSIDPEGITITYAKDNLFLTFGIKNVYQGSGDKKQLVGYKAYIEHN